MQVPTQYLQIQLQILLKIKIAIPRNVHQVVFFDRNMMCSQMPIIMTHWKTQNESEYNNNYNNNNNNHNNKNNNKK